MCEVNQGVTAKEKHYQTLNLAWWSQGSPFFEPLQSIDLQDEGSPSLSDGCLQEAAWESPTALDTFRATKKWRIKIGLWIHRWLWVIGQIIIPEQNTGPIRDGLIREARGKKCMCLYVWLKICFTEVEIHDNQSESAVSNLKVYKKVKKKNLIYTSISSCRSH